MDLLKQIAKVRAGYPFRGRIEPVPDGRTRVVQIRDVLSSGEVSLDGLIRTEVEDRRGEHLLRKGDVLFISRGTRRHAAAVTGEPDGVIASGQLFVLTPGPGVLPEFLAWLINQRPAQQYLGENAAGSNVRIITRPVLEHLRVDIPPLETQQKIVGVHKLSLREQTLLAAIAERRARLVEESLLRSLKNSNEDDRSSF
jgi:restriction endonuclease S subunit